MCVVHIVECAVWSARDQALQAPGQHQAQLAELAELTELKKQCVLARAGSSSLRA